MLLISLFALFLGSASPIVVGQSIKYSNCSFFKAPGSLIDLPIFTGIMAL